MIVGFNHNIAYRGVSFHVQTEDSGLKKPQLITLLYHGGTIISSQKTTYADILQVENLEKVVEDLAKDQHKGMLRRLTKGEFDDRIGTFGIVLTAGSPQSTQAPKLPEEKNMSEPVTSPSEEVSEIRPARIIEEPIVDKFKQRRTRTEPSLDDLIYAYLTAGR